MIITPSGPTYIIQLKIIKIITDCDEFDVDKYTLMYMKREGIQNVRGGSFNQNILDKSTISIIETMIRTASGESSNLDTHIKPEFKFEHIPYQKKVYLECVENLGDDEIIINQLSKHDQYNGMYYVNYLTNRGNILLGNHFASDHTTVHVLGTNNNELYTGKITQALAKIQFKSHQHNDLKKELLAYIEFMDSF